MENDPFAEGYVACLCDIDETQNPYDAELEKEAYTAWNDGYIFARDNGTEEEEDNT